MIELKDVVLRYDKRVVLDGISLKVDSGQIKAIIGPSGSGKSTIVKLMLGLIKPTEGQVLIDGVDITGLKEHELYPIRQKMGIVFQGNALFDSMTVVENMSFFLRENTKLSEKEIDKMVMEQMRFSGLEGFENMLPESLSGGMQKRVAIARALIFSPLMVLFDEPTAGLDPANANRILDLVLRMKKEIGLGAVIVTHIVSDVKKAADEICVLYNGKIIYDGDVSNFYSSTHPFIQNFLNNEEL